MTQDLNVIAKREDAQIDPLVVAELFGNSQPSKQQLAILVGFMGLGRCKVWQTVTPVLSTFKTVIILMVEA